jgi:hypothetical protein
MGASQTDPWSSPMHRVFRPPLTTRARTWAALAATLVNLAGAAGIHHLAQPIPMTQESA